LSPLGALEQRSAGIEGALSVDHTPTIKSVGAYKIVISFSLKYLETMYLYQGSQTPFIDFPSRASTNENIISIESI